MSNKPVVGSLKVLPRNGIILYDEDNETQVAILFSSNMDINQVQRAQGLLLSRVSNGINPGVYHWHPVCAQIGMFIGECVPVNTDVLNGMELISTSAYRNLVAYEVYSLVTGTHTIVLDNTPAGTILCGIN